MESAGGYLFRVEGRSQGLCRAGLRGTHPKGIPRDRGPRRSLELLVYLGKRDDLETEPKGIVTGSLSTPQEENEPKGKDLRSRPRRMPARAMRPFDILHTRFTYVCFYWMIFRQLYDSGQRK